VTDSHDRRDVARRQALQRGRHVKVSVNANGLPNSHIYRANFGGDNLLGSSSSDTFYNGQGNDIGNGNGGIDTWVSPATRATYSVTKTTTGYTVKDLSGNYGTDTLTNVQRLQFSDKKLALDVGVNQAGGETALLIGAVLGKASLSDKSLVGQFIEFFDAGNSMLGAANALVAAGVVERLAGDVSTSGFVSLIYKAVVGQTPPAADAKTLATLIDNGTFTKASFLAFVAEHSMNQTNVALVGLQQTGIEYL